MAFEPARFSVSWLSLLVPALFLCAAACGQ